MMIWACHAGKDVYIEKPASHSIGGVLGAAEFKAGETRNHG